MPLLNAEHFSLRLFYPVLIENFSSRVEVVAGIENATWGAASCKVWQRVLPPAKSTSEMLEEAKLFLFPQFDGRAPLDDDPHSVLEFQYIRPEFQRPPECFVLAQSLRDSWLDLANRKMVVVLNGEHEETWRKNSTGRRPLSRALLFHATRPVEFYLLHDRVGILSIQIETPSDITIPPNEAQDLCYHLSQTSNRCPRLRIQSSETDAHLCVPSPHVPEVRELPLEANNIAARLGSRGQSWTLAELKDLLLTPLNGLIRHDQEQFLCHSVLVYPLGTNFQEPSINVEAIRLAAALSQIEESAHALGSPGVPFEVLYENHVAAYSYLGAAHLVASQFSKQVYGGTFDAERVFVIQTKYAFPMLISIAQRLLCHAFLLDVIRRPEDLGEVWKRFRLFEIHGYLIDVSRRESVNRCYRLAQSAQRIHELIGSLHRTLRDDQSTQQNEQIKSTQDRIGQIEVFIVGFYTFEFFKILGEMLHFAELWIFTGMLCFAIASAYVVRLHHEDRTVRRELTVVLVAAAIWALGGLFLSRVPAMWKS